MKLQRHIVPALALFLAAVSTTPCGGQTSNFVNFGVEDGLIQSQVQTLNQDPDGNLWIGTIGGLSKYNGKAFVSLTRNDGLAEDWITASCMDSRGNLWFGHWGGGVSILEVADDTVRNLAFEPYSKYKTITAIAEDRQGDLWFGTENAGLFKYSVSAKDVTVVEGLSSNHVTSLCVDNTGRLWVGTAAGVAVIHTGNHAVIQAYGADNGLPAGKVTSVIAALGHEIWLATEGAGIFRIDARKELPASVSTGGPIEQINVQSGLPSANINLLYEDSGHNVWIGTDDRGVAQFIPVNFSADAEGLTMGEINTFGNKLELKYYRANVFFGDREGNMWMGTDIGLNQYKGELFRIYNHNDNLISNMVWCTMADHEGNAWFGTNEGVSRFRFPSTSGGKRLYNNPEVEHFTAAGGLPENVVISLYEDGDGNTWFGTENSGACVMNRESGKFSYFSTASGLGSNTVFAISADKSGNIWFATRNGAAMLDTTTSQITNYTEANGIGGSKVYSLYRDSRGNLWMGILGGYLTRYDGKTFRTYGEAEGLEQKFILSITEDLDGNLWLGSYGGGIYRYDGKMFTNYTTRDGLGSDSPHFLVCDESGNVWIGTNHGIEKLESKSGKFIRYGKKEGILGIETNQNAVSKDGSGNIWFGTIRGAVKLSPRSDRANKTAPLTFIDGLKIFLKETPFPAGHVFEYDQNHLTFTFTGISLTNPERVQYSYMLEGFDSDWSPPSLSDNVTYSNLHPGKYRLLVRAANNDEVWNREPAVYAFEIVPPFWLTWWFYAVCGLAAAGLVFLVVKLREHNLRRRQRELEEQVELRTRELRAEKEKVMQQHTVIARKNQQITDSITYAQKIQESILPSSEEIRKIFPESFILYMPKDIVSGDFYWMNNRNGRVLVGVVDCTGHGVPGAFMSLIGHNLMDKVVKEQQVTAPAEVLAALNREVTAALTRGSGEEEVKDGMDIALCAIDRDRMELEFAGAYNPLYIVRNGKVIELRGDRVPIGKRSKAEKTAYANHREKLEKGDTVYLFSDGFPDQKGGPQNRKFFYPPFRNLLASLGALSPGEQEERLRNTIMDWMKNREQTDDILIFGIRIQ